MSKCTDCGAFVPEGESCPCYAGSVGGPPETSAKPETQGEREAFEFHWYNTYHSGSITARSDGSYFGKDVQKAWEAWQARAALLADGKAGGEVVGRVNMWLKDSHAQWNFMPDAAAWAQPDYTDDAKSRGVRKSFTVYTRPQPAAQVAQPLTEYHCIGFVDGYDTQIKDKSDKMKAPRAVYVAVHGIGKTP